MPALPRRAERHGDHFIVCGDGPLAYRITQELTSRYGERVTVLLPSRQRSYGPQIGALPRVRVLEHPELSIQAFTDAGVQSARALAVVWQDDVGNLHAGLRAQELNPALRLVLAIYNRRLDDHIRMLFPDCTVLSGTAMSAPAFVAAALGEPAPSHIRVQRRTLYVARPGDVTSGHVLCGLVTPAETALNARALRDDVRIVLRLADDDLAERLGKTIANTVSRSVPYLAAPAFAAAMLEHQVLRTIAVGRHVLLIADVRVADQAGLAGSLIQDTEQDGQARVLARQVSGSSGLDWSPRRDYRLAPGDRLIVLATRKGLEPFLSVR